MDITKEINKVLIDLTFLDKSPEKTELLKDDLGIDSIKLVQLIIKLEEIFEINFDESDLNPSKIKTVEDLYLLVGKYI